MGVQEHASPGNLKLRSSEITGNVYSFLHLQSFQEGQPSYTKWGTLLESLKRLGYVPPSPVSTSMFMTIKQASKIIEGNQPST